MTGLCHCLKFKITCHAVTEAGIAEKVNHIPLLPLLPIPPVPPTPGGGHLRDPRANRKH